MRILGTYDILFERDRAGAARKGRAIQRERQKFDQSQQSETERSESFKRLKRFDHVIDLD